MIFFFSLTSTFGVFFKAWYINFGFCEKIINYTSIMTEGSCEIDLILFSFIIASKEISKLLVIL